MSFNFRIKDVVINSPSFSSFLDYLKKYTGNQELSDDDLVDVKDITELHGIENNSILENRYIEFFIYNNTNKSFDFIYPEEFSHPCKSSIYLPQYCIKEKPLDIILKGTYATFSNSILRIDLEQGPDKYEQLTIVREPHKISIRGRRKEYASKDYGDDFAPLCVAFHLQAPGGYGSYGSSGSSGGGGGSGGFVTGLLDFGSTITDNSGISSSFTISQSTESISLKNDTTILVTAYSGKHHTSSTFATAGAAGGNAEKNVADNTAGYYPVYDYSSNSTNPEYFGTSGLAGGRKGSAGSSFQECKLPYTSLSISAIDTSTPIIWTENQAITKFLNSSSRPSGGTSGTSGWDNGGGGAASLFANGGNGGGSGNGGYTGSAGSGGGGGHLAASGSSAGSSGPGFFELFY